MTAGHIGQGTLPTMDRLEFAIRDVEDARVGALKRMKWVAAGLLVAALAGLALAVWRGGEGGGGWVEAFCEASEVGAVADGFAVVALFRRPLGLPLPHTAILPRSKDRVADGLAHFVRDHFLDPATLVARLGVFDPARRLGDWLADPARGPRWGRGDAAR